MNQWMKIQQNSDMKKYTYYRKKIKSPNSMFSIILFCEGKMLYSPANIHFSRQGSLPKYQQRTLLANVKSICVRESHPHSEDSRLFFLPGTVQGSFPLSKWMQWTTSVSRWKIWPPSCFAHKLQNSSCDGKVWTVQAVTSHGMMVEPMTCAKWLNQPHPTLQS